MNNLSWAFLFYAAGCIFGFYVVWLVGRSLKEVDRFGTDVTKLARGEAQERDLFKSKSTLDVHAHQFLRKFCDASDGNHLNRFDCERTLQPINAAFRSLSARPRALAGVLILAGLLITLFNLQFSVHNLGSVFHQLSSQVSQGPEAHAPGSSVEQAMGDIADSARNAFLYSALVMSIAAIVLLLAVRVHRLGSAALLELARWASDTQNDLLASIVPTDLDSTVAHMSATVDKLDHMIAMVGEFGDAISSVKGFADEMSNASREIASAVQKLPDNINSSIVHFSGDVARGISESLDHHVQYIEKLLVIYGDQKARFEETHKFMADTLENTKKTIDALAPLETVPDALRMTAREIGFLARVVWKMRALESKIDGLPRGDLSKLITALEVALPQLQEMVKKTAEFVGHSPGANAVSELIAKFERLSELVAKGESDGAVVTGIAEIRALRADLEQVSQRLAKVDADGETLALVRQIKALLDQAGRITGPGIRHRDGNADYHVERILPAEPPEFWPYRPQKGRKPVSE